MYARRPGAASGGEVNAQLWRLLSALSMPLVFVKRFLQFLHCGHATAVKPGIPPGFPLPRTMHGPGSKTMPVVVLPF